MSLFSFETVFLFFENVFLNIKKSRDILFSS